MTFSETEEFSLFLLLYKCKFCNKLAIIVNSGESEHPIPIESEQSIPV